MCLSGGVGLGKDSGKEFIYPRWSQTAEKQGGLIEFEQLSSIRMKAHCLPCLISAGMVKKAIPWYICVGKRSAPLLFNSEHVQRLPPPPADKMTSWVLSIVVVAVQLFLKLQGIWVFNFPHKLFGVKVIDIYNRKWRKLEAERQPIVEELLTSSKKVMILVLS